MSEQVNNQVKDPIISFKSVAQSVNDQGKKRVTLSMSQEQTLTLIETLTAAAGNVRGTKLDIHIKKKETNDGSRTFDSAFAFVKQIQEFGAGRGAGASGQSFPKSPSKGYVGEDRLAAAKAKLSKTIA